MIDYYQILEVNQDSSVDDIKQAYRKLAKQYHPDVNTSPEAHQRFIDITEAYEVLMQRASDFNDTETQVNYEEVMREIRENSRKHAQMRYNKLQRQQAAFRESGLYDAGLLLKYIGKILVPIVAVAMILVPVSVCVSEQSIQPFFYLFFFWLIGGFILYYAYQQRNNYFQLGIFYYSFSKICDLFTKTNENATDNCFYCKELKANSIPFILNLFKVKGIKLQNTGPMQHQAVYDTKNYTIVFPRSQKAFVVHSLVSCIRFCSIILAINVLPISHIAWRFVGGIAIGWILSALILLFSKTRSKTLYLLSYGMLIKIILWLFVLSFISVFKFSPFNILATDKLHLGIVLYLFIDAFIEQILKLPKQVSLFKPLLKQYTSISHQFNEKCQLYLEIPFWTTINPIIRWIF